MQSIKTFFYCCWRAALGKKRQIFSLVTLRNRQGWCSALMQDKDALFVSFCVCDSVSYSPPMLIVFCEDRWKCVRQNENNLIYVS